MTLFAQQWKAFWLAVQFMSRLPTPQFAEVQAKDMGRAIAWFPVVGSIIGLGLWGLAQFSLMSSLPIQVSAALLLLFWVWVTGALHLDGLADSCDAWLGATQNPKRALEIMKDSRIGTGGGVALVVILLLKWSLLVAVLEAQLIWILLFAPIIGRIAAIALMPVTHYASQDGMAESMFQHLNKPMVILWVGLALGLLLYWQVWLVLLALLFWWWVRAWMIRLTGGMTGDTAGAMTELMEVWLLLCVVAFFATP